MVLFSMKTKTWGLLHSIIAHNDVDLLKEYFAIEPQVIPNLFELPDGHEEICEFGCYFSYAAECGSLGILQTLLEYTTKSFDKGTPIRLSKADFQLLNVAAQFGQIEIVQWLLDTEPLYAGIEDRDLRGFTALAAAANIFEFRLGFSPTWDQIRFDNSDGIMKLLLDHGACASDVAHPTNDKDRKVPSVLSLAAQWATTDLLERLIGGGADVHYKVAANSWQLDFGKQRDLPNKIEVNSLFLASLHASHDGVKTLVDRRAVGVDVADMLLSFAPTTINVQDNDRNTALHYATRYFGKNGSMFTPIFELLCSRGANASLRNYKDETPLHALFQSHGDDGPIDIAAVSLLLSHGAKVTDVDEAGNTPLHIANRNWQFIDAVALLLEYGADPAQKDLKQENALPTKMEYLLGNT